MRLLILLIIISCLGCKENKKATSSSITDLPKVDLVALLDTIWRTEQVPIRLRDSIGRKLGFESKAFQKQQVICDRNHEINEKKIIELLDKQGWPNPTMMGERGNLTICNVLQHSDIEVRLKYLPMMRAAVAKKSLEPRFLARAEDRIATDRGELQVYGGQIKYYPETKSFDVWPILDPANVDKRRAEIGLQPMAEFLNSRRTPMKWDLEKQIERSEAFEQEKAKNENR